MNDPSLVKNLQPHVQPGEKVLWAGRPGQGIRFRPSDWFLIPFSLLWGCFAIFWEAMVIWNDAPFYFKLHGIPFVLIGLYFMFGRFLWDAHVRSQIVYFLTNERVITLRGGSIKSSSLGSLPQLSLSMGRAAEGRIDFGATQFSGYGYNILSPSTMGGSFEFVADAKSVYAEITRAQSALRRS